MDNPVEFTFDPKVISLTGNAVDVAELPAAIDHILLYEWQRTVKVVSELQARPPLSWEVYSALLESCILGIINISRLISQSMVPYASYLDTIQIGDRPPSDDIGTSEDNRINHARGMARMIMSNPIEIKGHKTMSLCKWVEWLTVSISPCLCRLVMTDRVTLSCIPVFLRVLDKALLAYRGILIPEMGIDSQQRLIQLFRSE